MDHRTELKSIVNISLANKMHGGLPGIAARNSISIESVITGAEKKISLRLTQYCSILSQQ